MYISSYARLKARLQDGSKSDREYALPISTESKCYPDPCGGLRFREGYAILQVMVDVAQRQSTGLWNRLLRVRPPSSTLVLHRRFLKDTPGQVPGG